MEPTNASTTTDSPGAESENVRLVRLVRRLFEAFYSANEASMSSVVSMDFVTHTSDGGTGNAEGWKSLAHQLMAAMPDNETKIDDIFGADNRVAVRYTSRGTLTGELFGVKPTGRSLTTSGIEIYRLDGDRIVEVWGQYDMSELFNPRQ